LITHGVLARVICHLRHIELKADCSPELLGLSEIRLDSPCFQADFDGNRILQFITSFLICRNCGRLILQMWPKALVLQGFHETPNCRLI